MGDLKHYLILIGIMLLGFAAFWYFNYWRPAQIIITLLMMVTYVVWGAVHHLIKKDFHWWVALEYLVVASVAGMTIIFLLVRS